MADWQAIRELARAGRAEVAGSADSLIPAEELLGLALEREGLWSQPAARDDAALAGADALLLRDERGILYNADLAAERTRFNIAHELAHWRLHDESAGCRAHDILPDPVSDPLPYGEDAVRGYSPAQRRETEANIFAAEFLLPVYLARRQFLNGVAPSELAARLGIPEATVLGQMARILLTEDGGRGTESAEPLSVARSPSSIALDESQRAAAEVESGPTLVVAGPGTGKTRTLIARIEVLLGRGVAPERVLALTFSNRATEEMRERLAVAAPEAARRVWIGTFHAFGLELLRRFGGHLGLPPAPALVDPLDAIGLLETHLSELNLCEYEYLHNPIFPFRDILSAISRAKDELVTPERYADLAAEMEGAAEDDKQRLAAARAREVAHIYAVWQRILQQEGKLDFGDLLMRSVELLENHSDVRKQVRSEYEQILVDEYQDINRASAVLMRLVSGEGRGLWAVGDLRQAIYGFRGAAPANLIRFEEDFPGGRRITLDVNYRSRAPIVRLFGAAARDKMSPTWEAAREGGEDPIVYAEAEDELAQADGIAESIRRFEQKGIALPDQAILLRTNAQAEAMAALLEEREIAVVYLGDLLARPEVRDMLTLLSLACEGNGSSLWRLAQIPEYDASPDEVRAVLDRGRSEELRFPEGLKGCGVPGLERLYEHVAPLAYRGDAYSFCVSYLFGPAHYLRNLVRSDRSAARQSRLALYQLLQLAQSHARRLAPDEEHPQRAFLAHVRRLLVTREDTRARMPTGAEVIPGVRLMTVHASKGLEFPVVFLPNLAKDLFPSRSRGSMVKPPLGLVSGESEIGDEDARLFFVALSRARDHLVLSRPLNVGGKPREASSLLSLIESALDESATARVRWECASPPGPTSPPGPLSLSRRGGAEGAAESACYSALDLGAAEVEQYMRCGRQFYYQRVLNLPTPANRSAYGAFQRCVWEVVRWARDERAAGRTPDAGEVEDRLGRAWNEHGPGEHAHAQVLRARASEIVRRVAEMDKDDRAAARIAQLVAELPSGRVRIPLDHAAATEDAISIERYESGRAGDADHTSPRLALIRHAANQRDSGRKAEIRLRYLATGEVRPVPEQTRWEPARVEKYERALQGIRAERFEPHPSDDNCPFCPFFFICPR